jgi:hypothetical protein
MRYQGEELGRGDEDHLIVALPERVRKAKA